MTLLMMRMIHRVHDLVTDLRERINPAANLICHRIGQGSGSGGGSDPDEPGGGRGSTDSGFPYIAPGAPYGTLVPTIEPKLKIESLPEWDGDHDTAIDYFWEVGQLATLSGWMPKALAYWLPSRLKKDSPVHLWFSTLPTARQADMRGHYMNYLQTMKERYLGKRWQLETNLKFEAQAFRQEGHEKESPQSFIGRRIKYVRMLANTDDGGPLEVFLVMKKAPIRWCTILVLENIHSIEELYDKVNEHAGSLVDAVRRSAPDIITVHSLASNLRRLGLSSTGNVHPIRQVNFSQQALTEDPGTNKLSKSEEPASPEEE